MSRAERVATSSLKWLFLLMNLKRLTKIEKQETENPDRKGDEPSAKIAKRTVYRNLKTIGYDRRFWRKRFPYRIHWRYVIRGLQQNEKAKDYVMPKEGTTHLSFNQYKMVLCIEAPDVFAFVQGYEYTSRLFSGMFLASLYGSIVFIFLTFYAISAPVADFFVPTYFSTPVVIDQTWFYFLTSFSLISLVMYCTFGIQLPRVRSREVEYLLLAYISLTETVPRKTVSNT